MKLENENEKDFYFVLISLICGHDVYALDLTINPSYSAIKDIEHNTSEIVSDDFC